MSKTPINSKSLDSILNENDIEAELQSLLEELDKELDVDGTTEKPDDTLADGTKMRNDSIYNDCEHKQTADIADEMISNAEEEGLDEMAKVASLLSKRGYTRDQVNSLLEALSQLNEEDDSDDKDEDDSDSDEDDEDKDDDSEDEDEEDSDDKEDDDEDSDSDEDNDSEDSDNDEDEKESVNEDDVNLGKNGVTPTVSELTQARAIVDQKKIEKDKLGARLQEIKGATERREIDKKKLDQKTTAKEEPKTSNDENNSSNNASSKTVKKEDFNILMANIANTADKLFEDDETFNDFTQYWLSESEVVFLQECYDVRNGDKVILIPNHSLLTESETQFASLKEEMISDTCSDIIDAMEFFCESEAKEEEETKRLSDERKGSEDSQTKKYNKMAKRENNRRQREEDKESIRLLKALDKPVKQSRKAANTEVKDEEIEVDDGKGGKTTQKTGTKIYTRTKRNGKRVTTKINQFGEKTKSTENGDKSKYVTRKDRKNNAKEEHEKLVNAAQAITKYNQEHDDTKDHKLTAKDLKDEKDNPGSYAKTQDNARNQRKADADRAAKTKQANEKKAKKAEETRQNQARIKEIDKEISELTKQVTKAKGTDKTTIQKRLDELRVELAKLNKKGGSES